MFQPSVTSRPIYQARFGSPSCVGLGGEILETFLPGDFDLLLGDRWRVRPLLTQPLVPHRWNLHIAVMSLAGVSHDAPPAGSWVGAPDVAEFPVGVAIEVKA